MRRLNIRRISLIFIFILPVLVYAQDTTMFRVMSYNLLNYEGQDSKAGYFQTIINEIDPDVIVAQEVMGSAGYNQFLSEILNPDNQHQWTGAPFTNQSADQDIALFYKHDKFTFISTMMATSSLSYGLRGVVEFILEHDASGVVHRFYGLHFKASSGAENADKRKTEATRLRNYLNGLDSNSYFMVCGDFNIYGSGEVSGYTTYTEEVYPILTEEGSDSDGQTADPLNAPGTWHENSSFAYLHSQSTRKEALSDGGSSGGLDDRFDMILMSTAYFDSNNSTGYLEDSYTVFGNDARKLNLSINSGNNLKVSSDVADALYYASDHLPVYIDILHVSDVVSITDLSTIPAEPLLSAPYPNPFNPQVRIPYSVLRSMPVTVSVYRVDGQLIETLFDGNTDPGAHTLTWEPDNISSGIYIIALKSGRGTANRKVLYLK